MPTYVTTRLIDEGISSAALRKGGIPGSDALDDHGSTPTSGVEVIDRYIVAIMNERHEHSVICRDIARRRARLRRMREIAYQGERTL